MLLNYWIYDSNNYTLAANNQTWVGSNNFNTTWSTPGLSTGNYTLHADLYVDGTWVDSYESSFGVISNNTGGNNTGGNNTVATTPVVTTPAATTPVVNNTRW